MISDFPTYPLDVLADANTIAGLLLVHINYGNIGLPGLPAALANHGYLDMNDAILQDQYGDTDYYLIPAKRLPMLMPLAMIGVPDPVLATLDAPLRVLVEAGYDRTISPGQPTTAQLFPTINPRTPARNVAVAIPTGIDDGLQEMGLGRPFGTVAAGPYGVGGPPVALPANSSATMTAAFPKPDATSRNAPSLTRARQDVDAETPPHQLLGNRELDRAAVELAAKPNARGSWPRKLTKGPTIAPTAAAPSQPETRPRAPGASGQREDSDAAGDGTTEIAPTGWPCQSSRSARLTAGVLAAQEAPV